MDFIRAHLARYAAELRDRTQYRRPGNAFTQQGYVVVSLRTAPAVSCHTCYG